MVDAANLLGDRNIVGSVSFALCNAAEALITAGLIDRYVGTGFSLGRLRHVLAGHDHGRRQIFSAIFSLHYVPPDFGRSTRARHGVSLRTLT